MERPWPVLYIEEWPELAGGGQQFLLQLIRGLDRKRFSPLIALPGPGSFAEALSSFGIEPFFVPILSFKNPLHWGSNLCSLWRLRRICLEKGVRLIHANSILRGTIYAGLVGRSLKIPTLWHVHRFRPERILEAVLAALVDRVILVSRAGFSLNFSFLEKTPKGVVIYNGIDVKRFQERQRPSPLRKTWGVSEETPLLGMVGVLHPIKGFDILFQSLQEIKKILTDFRLWVVGEDGTPSQIFRKSYEGEVRSRGLQENVLFLGKQEDIPEILSALDYFLMPTVTHEAFPMVILEAMAAGLPIIASRIGGIPEAIEEGVSGILVPPGDAEALTEAILGLLRNRGRALELGKSARKRVEAYFTVEKNVSKVQDLYERLITGDENRD